MKILNVQQGSAEWHAAREQHHTASEAPAMMGASKYLSRSELLRLKAGGEAAEVSGAQQRIFDRGHETEASARPIVETMIGEELYPCTATDDDGWLLASFDGLTMLGDTGFEHKLWSEDLAAQVRAGEIEPHYYWQLEQQLLVSGAERIVFVCSDGTEENFASLEYRAVPGRREQLVAGWQQFEKDLAEYTPPAPAAEVVGRPPEALPALRIEVTGMVTASNLAEFREHALEVFGRIKTELTTDADFADAEKTVKWCGEVEQRLEAAKQHALSQTASIDELFRTIDEIKEEARRVRLNLDRSVKAEKEKKREEIRQGAVNALRDHYAGINATFAGRVMLGVPASFGADVAAAMKGKRTIASLQDAADTTLAAAKVEADATANRVRVNLQIIDEHQEHAALLPDAEQLATSKSAEDLRATITARVAERQAAEERRLEAERERIRKEEAARLEAEQRAKEQAEAGAAAVEQALEEFVNEVADEVAASVPAASEPVVKADEPATLKLGDIRDRLGLALPADFIAEVLGIEPAGKQRSAVLYRESDFHRICTALARHVIAVRDGESRRAA